MIKPHAPTLIEKIGIVPVKPREAALAGEPCDVAEGNDLARMAAHVDKINKGVTDDCYQIRIGGVIVDPYRIAREYDLDSAIAQAVKKLLRCGRKHKSIAEDVREAITTLERWEAMEAEDANNSVTV
jgi:hypothetical protein